MNIYNPVSSYRLQFNRNFTFNEAEAILPYLHKTGIRTIYASPVLEAVKGSNHGYDVTNVHRINPEIGTEEDFLRLIEKVHGHDMGWIQDIVPNHMAFSVENAWIYDVLEKGKSSKFYEYFDIVEDHPDPDLNSKLMLPFFGKPVGDLIRDKELTVVYARGGFKLKYFDTEYPVSIPAYEIMFKSAGAGITFQLITDFINAGKIVDEFDEFKQKLANEYEHNAEVSEFMRQCLEKCNSNSDILKSVVDKLYYYPSFWRDTETRINYRRFFTINGLICLNIQNKEVFESCHSLVKEWIDNELIDGVRIDHIDGLFNPTEYLERLRKITGDRVVIYVEKILEEGEKLLQHWPVQGSTGYDFLSLINNLLTNRDTGPLFNSFYSDWIKKPIDYNEVFLKNSRFILYQRLSGELDNLTRRCLRLQPVLNYTHDFQKIRAAIGEFLVACPVYKVYSSPSGFTDHEVNMVKMIGEKAIKVNSDNKHGIQFLTDLFLLKLPGSRNDLKETDAFFRRCMQFTGPLMAKGIEDTAFYSYNPFIGHNEVGDSPGYFGITTQRFHEAIEDRLKNMPYTMNAISTHDTKRGEDARARLNVLSDMPVKWMDEARQWRETNKGFKRKDDDREIPTANDEYFIYQVLCAHLPMNAGIDGDFKKRLREYFIKAIREAKVNSSWSNPDVDYEDKMLGFIDDILNDKSSFPKELVKFMEEIIPHGIMNSLTQVILKNTIPGVSDTFQGTEQWNLNFVDPDNRRPVNYLSLAENLKELEEAFEKDPAHMAMQIMNNPQSGRLKQWVTWITLRERSMFPELFLKGSYIPLKVIGQYHKRVIAFYRHYQKQHMVVILPLSTATLEGDYLWEDTQIRLPETVPSELRNIFTEMPVEAEKILHVDEVFDIVPFAILRNYPV